MKKNIFSAIFMAALMLVTSVAFTSCRDEELDTDPFAGTVAMAGYSPNPVARGGELFFIGTGLDKVTKVIFSENVEVTEFLKKEADTLRLIVPKTAQPGVLTLIAGDKVITSRSSLSFTEPVAFAEKDALSGTVFYPGDTLMIKGSYLNLVKNIVFGGDAYSPVFEYGNNTPDEPMDMWCKVVVPAEAVSGKIKLSFVATGATEENLVPSSEAIEIIAHNIPTPLVIEAGVPGETYKVAGKYLDLVTTLFTPEGDSLACQVNADGTEISFVVPNYITNGAITAASASGIKHKAFDFTLFFPEDVAATPVDGVRGGDSITLTATHLELIEKVIFSDVKGKPLEAAVAAGKVAFPADAASGAIKIVTMAETRDEADVVFTTLKPAFTSISKDVVEAEDTVVVTGTNLDLISSIEFVGSGSDTAYLIPVSATEMMWYCPKGTKTGAVKVTMINGEVIAEFTTLTMATPNGCYVLDETELVTTEERPLKAGDVICFSVENIDRLQEVTIDGEAVNIIMNGNKLYVATPAEPKTTFTMALISDNDLQTYTLKLKQCNQSDIILWSGASALGWEGDGQVYIGADGGADLVAAGVRPGDKLRIAFTPTGDDWKAQIFEGHWNPQYDEITAANYDLAGNGGYYYLTLTQEMITAMTTPGGWGGLLVCQGQNLIVSQLVLIHFESVEVKINGDCVKEDDQSVAWTFPSLMTWDANGRFRILRNGPSNLGSSVQLGTKIRFYKSGTGQIQVNNPNWTAITYVADWNGNVNPLEVVVDQAILDCFTGVTTDGWSETALILQGDGLTIEKITIE